MYWNQDENPDTVVIPDDIVDILFALDCKQLPVDHAYALSDALCQALPWMTDEPRLAIHTVHVAGSQNGWERPAHGTGNHLHLSRRTKLTIRAPKERVEQLLADLPGTRVEVDGCPLEIGAGKAKPLSKATTLFARYVVADLAQSEDAFLAAAARALSEMDIQMRKALCGRSTALVTPRADIPTRSLMLADLTAEESFRLQRLGLGPHRLIGCGVFIPHKGIEPVSGNG
jgi:CRISPR-associated protein Cas6